MYKHKKITRARFSNKKYSPLKYPKETINSYTTCLPKKTNTST